MIISKKLARALALCACSALFCTTIQAQTKLLAAQSDIGFVTKQMGVALEGHFKKFDAHIAFDPAKPQTGSVTLSIDTASATMGAAEADAELPKSVWFNTKLFPVATFQSNAIKSVGPGKFEVSGKLTIKGNVRDAVVPLALTQNGSITVATGVFTIQRLGFKIGENEWADTSMLADDVQVKFKLALVGMAKL